MADSRRTVSVHFSGTVRGLRLAAKRANLILASVGRGTWRLFKFLEKLALASTVAPTIIGIVTALGQLLSIVTVLPAALLAAVGGFAVLKLATKGFGAAVSAATPTDFVQAMRSLPPSMQSAVRATRALRPQMRELRQIVQANFWTGFDEDVTVLADRYLPVLRKQFGAIATALSILRTNAVSSLISPRVIAALNRALAFQAEMWRRLGPAVGPFLEAFSILAEIGSRFLPRFADWVTRGAVAFERWVTAGEQSGSIERMIEDSIQAWKDLFAVARNVWQMFDAILSALAGVTDPYPLAWLRRMTERMRDFFRSGEQQSWLTELGETLRAVAHEIHPLLAEAFRQLQTLITALSPPIISLAQAFNRVFVPALQKIIPAVSSLIDSMGPAFTQALQSLTKFLVDWLIPALVSLVNWLDRAFQSWNRFASSNGGFLGGLAQSVSNFFGGLFGRASGGEVQRGRSYLVGENGPEMFTPGRSGSITPNGAMGGGDTYVNVRIGETDLREIIRTEIRRADSATALSVFSGRGVYA